MFSAIVKTFWGDLSKDEVKKFSILSAMLMLILGNYWMLRVTKNALFGQFVDFRMYQPYVKIVSLVVMIFMVMFYSKLVDLLEKHKLFYLFCTGFGLWLIGLSFLIANPSLISVSETSAFAPFVSWIPGKFIGWLTYVSFEATSLIIALFWAFVASTTKAESAKKGYGMIIFFTQIGTISGPLFVKNYVHKLGLPTIVALGGMLFFLVMGLVKLYTVAVPMDNIIDKKANAKKPKTGFLEGLKILASRPYVMGIFVVATVYEIVGTILEFQMNSLARLVYPIAEDFAAFNSNLGISINTLALLFALLGTSFVMRKFGLRFCLIAFPSIVGTIVASVFIFNFSGATHYQLMWALFVGMVGIKGFTYALNNPTKEVMYIPTSKDIKFKAKGWIDIFGGRTTKGAGSGINAMFAGSLPQLLMYGTIISLGIVGVWIVVASLLGTAYNKLQRNNTIVE